MKHTESYFAAIPMVRSAALTKSLLILLIGSSTIRATGESESFRLPDADEVFTIAEIGQHEGSAKYLTPENILKALPRMKPGRPDPSSVTEEQKRTPLQTGVIVLNDKTVLMWATRRSHSILIFDKTGKEFSFLIPKRQPDDDARDAKALCLNHLKQIGLALRLYSGDYQERFPDQLEQLSENYQTDKKVWTCPSSGAKEGTMSYVYVGKGLTERTSPDTILAYDADGNHPDGRNVLFADGHVAWMEESAFQKALKAR